MGLLMGGTHWTQWIIKKKDKEEKKDEEEEKEEGRKNQVMVVHNLKPSPWEAEASQILISSMSA